MKKRWLLLFLLIAFLGTLLLRFPIAAVPQWVNLQPVHIQHLSGHLLSGQAYGIQAPQNVHIESAEWQIQLSKLFQGALGADVRVASMGAQGQGDVSLHWDQTLGLKDTRITAPASVIEQAVGLPFFKFFGDLSLDLAEARANQQRLLSVNGQALWQSALIKGTVEADLGNIRADLSTQNQNLVAQLSNQGGTLNIQGSASLTPAGDYQTDIQITPAAGTHNHILQALSMMGSRAADGSYRLQQTGNIHRMP